MTLTQISTAGVKDDAVTSGKIPANAVGSSELADNAVDTAAIVDDAVTSAKIADNAISRPMIQDNAINADKIADSNVTTAKILDSNVTTAKIANDAVTYAKMQNTADGVRFLGKHDSGGGEIGEITKAQALTMLNVADGATYSNINGNVNNNVLTATGTSGVSQGESNLTFNGSSLAINGSTLGEFHMKNNGTDQCKALALNGLLQVITQNSASLSFHFATNAGSGNEKIRISNHGLTFGGDTAAANALHDYEEGTWTPTIKENGSGTAWNTLSNQQGHYTKVGNLVTINFAFDYSGRASNVNQGYYGFIAGLPYTNTTTSKNQGVGTLMVAEAGGNSAPYHIYLNTSTGNSMPVYKNQDSTTPGPITTSEWPDASAKVRGTFFYYTQ